MRIGTSISSPLADCVAQPNQLIEDEWFADRSFLCRNANKNEHIGAVLRVPQPGTDLQLTENYPYPVLQLY